MLREILPIPPKDLERILKLIPGTPTYASVTYGLDADKIPSFAEKFKEIIRGKEGGSGRLSFHSNILDPSKNDLLNAYKSQCLGEDYQKKEHLMTVILNSIHWNFDKEGKVISFTAKSPQTIDNSLHLTPNKIEAHYNGKKEPRYVSKLRKEVEHGQIYVPELKIHRREGLTLTYST